MTDYSIVIPAYNEEEELPATLLSIQRAMQAVVPRVGEVVVTDNNSTDCTREVAEKFGARVVFEPHNQISRARNAGGRAARGRNLIFIDADTRIPQDLLQKALANLESGKIAGGGAAVDFDCPLSGLNRAGLRAWNWLSRTQRLAAGSFVYCLAEAFAATGGFSEEIYAGEEILFSQSVRRWGRTRNLDFVIITDVAVVTSSRKLRWYSPRQVLGAALYHLLFPWTLKARKNCSFWYQRPTATQPVDAGRLPNQLHES